MICLIPYILSLPLTVKPSILFAYEVYVGSAFLCSSAQPLVFARLASYYTCYEGDITL